MRAARDAHRFARLPFESRQIVFYAEGGADGKYLYPIVEALTRSEGVSVTYLTSYSHDPIFSKQNSNVIALYIGAGVVRTWVFQTLRAGVLATTTPDLAKFHLKRSAVYPVHYAYIHHSLVSTHRIYREGAFDHFDSILCAGPHHQREIRAWEILNGLPQKRLFEHGYAPLDWLLDAAANCIDPPRVDGRLRVLVAPSWGPDGLIEMGAEVLVSSLLDANYSVVVRAHPMTSRLSGQKLTALANRFRGNHRFTIEPNTATLDSLMAAHVMISDWSGVAMEFAFGLGRPVLFIDGPPKTNNPRWAEIGITPLEAWYRQEAGQIVPPNRPAELPRALDALWENRRPYAASARRLRGQYVHNLGRSAVTGAQIIASLVKEVRTERREDATACPQ